MFRLSRETSTSNECGGLRDHGHAGALDRDAVAELHVGEIEAAGVDVQAHARVAVGAERLD